MIDINNFAKKYGTGLIDIYKGMVMLVYSIIPAL